MDAQNNNASATGFEDLALALASFGHTLEARTRLAFGKNVASALKGIESGGYVVVLCEGMTDSQATKYQTLVAQNKNKSALVDARDANYSRVRPNVATFLKSRKIGASITPPLKNEDGDAIAFLVRKPAQNVA